MARWVAWSMLSLALVLPAALRAQGEEGAEAGAADARADRLIDREAPTRPLALAEAVRMGLRANLALLAGSYDPAIAMEAYRAEYAIFDPLVSAGFEYGHNEQPVTSAFFGRPVVQDETLHLDAGVSKLLKTGGSVSFLYQADRLDTDSQFVTLNPSWTHGAAVEATQPILRGAGDVVMNDIRLARNGVTIAQQNQRALVGQILLQVVTAYWNLVYAQEQVLARIKSEDVAGELLRDAQARLKAKVGTPLDVAQAQAGVERRRGDRIRAVAERGAAQDALRRLILPFSRNDRDAVVFVAKDPVDQETGLSPEETELDRYVDLAVANRAELRAAKANLANRDIDMFSAANAVKPQLDVIGRLGTAGLDSRWGTSLGNTADGQAISGAIGLQFSMFIGQRAAKANLRLTEWARRQAAINVKELENEIVQEVRGAIRYAVAAKAYEAASKEEVRAASEELRGERHLLDNGKSTPYNVLQKEGDLTDAQTRMHRSSTDRRIAEAGFWRSIGFLAEALDAPDPADVLPKK